jgi:hypothetical protein
MKFSRSDFEMQRFESRRPNRPARLQRVTNEGRSKTARYRRFRRYERVSVCGICQWKCHFGPLSAAAIFGVSFFTERRSGAAVLAKSPAALPTTEAD